MRRHIVRVARWFAIGCTALFALLLIAMHWADGRMHGPVPPGLVREQIETDTQWTLSYLRAPGAEDKRRIIYVHGTPGSATAFADYLVRPIDGFEAISIDRPGFGETAPGTAAVSLRDQAKVIEPLLVEREGGWPILVGHSLGAPVILQAAADYPDRVGGLVLLAGSVDPALESPYWIQYVGEFAFVPYLLPKSVRSSNHETIKFRAELEKLADDLDKITCPVVVVHAPDDSLVPYANVAFLERTLPNSVLIESRSLPGRDHFLPWNSEDEVRDLIALVAQPHQGN